MNQSVGTYTYLLLGGNNNVEELDYECGPRNAPIVVLDRCEVCGDNEDCEIKKMMKMVTMKVMDMEMEMFKIMDMFRLS